jgi:hypothetical protein
MTPREAIEAAALECEWTAKNYRWWASEAAGWPITDPICPEADELDRLASAIRAIPVPEAWQPIETAPKDNTPHIRGLWVYARGTRLALYWDAVAGYTTDDGQFVTLSADDTGWDADDYTHWMPMPAPPKEPIS